MKKKYCGEMEFVYVPKELAKMIADSCSVENYERELLQYIEDSKFDLSYSIEDIDEAILLYKAKMITARNAFKEAKEAELDANYVLWETYEKDIKSTRQYIEAAKKEVLGLAHEVSLLNEQLYKFDVNRINAFLQSLKQLQGFMSEEKELAKLVLGFYSTK